MKIIMIMTAILLFIVQANCFSQNCLSPETIMSSHSGTEFISDDELKYHGENGQEYRHESGLLQLSDNYRERFMGLVDGTTDHHCYDPRTSLAFRIKWQTLYANPSFREMLEDIERSQASNKISLQPQDSIHFTVPINKNDGWEDKLISEGIAASTFKISIKGLFWNTYIQGRTFLKVYPESQAERNPLQDIIESLGGKHFGVYPIGIFQLTNDLTEDEAIELQGIIDAYRDIVFSTVEVNNLAIVEHENDLLIGSKTKSRIDFTNINDRSNSEYEESI